MLYPNLLLLMSGSTRVAPKILATTTASAICVNHPRNIKSEKECRKRKGRIEPSRGIN